MRTLCASCTQISIYFHRLRKFSDIVFKYFLPAPFSLTLRETSIMWMSVCLKHPSDLLSCPHFFLLLFFSIQLQRYPLLCLPAHQSFPLYHIIYYWFFLSFIFQFHVLYYLSLSQHFIFSNSTLITSYLSLCSSSLLQSSLNIFSIITLNSLWYALLVSTLLSSSGILFCFYFEPYSFVTSFCLIYCFSSAYFVFWLYFLTLEKIPLQKESWESWQLSPLWSSELYALGWSLGGLHESFCCD